MQDKLTVAFVGNPNCGKTTLFNAYTGARLKVANWPGVTVEKKEGAFRFHEEDYRLVDLPGTYSLTSYTMEEKLSRSFILGEDGDGADVIVNVVDASSLERNLYLTLQLLELGKPVVVALNMMDIVEKRGMEIDIHRLPEMLGVPVIPVSARRRTGLDVLMHAVAHHKSGIAVPVEHHHGAGSHRHDHHSEFALVYSDELEDKIDAVEGRILEKHPEIVNARWHAIKLLERDGEVCEKLRDVSLDGITAKSLESEFISQKYDFIEEVVEECVCGKTGRAAVTEKADSILTHRFFGLPIFFFIMAAVFFLTFTVGDVMQGWLEELVGGFSEITASFLSRIGTAGWLESLIVDGIIAGVGGILLFLPNIAILFLCLAFLEDSGYMSRVAYIMDSIMGSIGLSGRAFIPMLLGFGCTVPAIMATRTLEDRRDKLRTMLVVPFMSCSARLPVYVLFSGMFFGKWAPLAALSMYFIGLAVAIIVAKIVSFTEKKQVDDSPLLIELPEYKSPSARTVAIYVWDKVKDYLSRAGSVIFVASVIIWLLLNVGPHGMNGNMEDSFGAILGRVLEPVLRPAGLGMWQIAVALIAGIAAKEVVVSACAVLFGVQNITSAAGMASFSAMLAGEGFGALNAYCLMLFVLLYVPCAATIGTIKSETRSLGRTVASVAMQVGVAWCVSTLVFQIGSLF